MRYLFIISSIALTAVLAAGCATTKQATPQLTQAQEAYSQARNDPTVSQNAPVALYDAEQALNKAENADNEAAQRHWAYVAEQRVKLAQSQAAQAADQKQLDQLQAQQDQMLMEKRALEAAQAREEARQAQEELRAYRSQEQEQALTQARRQSEQAQEEIRQLKQQIADSQAKQTDQGVVLTLSNVLFATEQAQLKPGTELSISQLADFLKNHPDRHVIIEGHTDSRGTQEYNQQLSQARAQAVAQALEAQGIGADRITARGMGESYPIAPNTTAAGRQENRRVNIIIQNPQQRGDGQTTPSGT